MLRYRWSVRTRVIESTDAVNAAVGAVSLVDVGGTEVVVAATVLRQVAVTCRQPTLRRLRLQLKQNNG